MSPIRWFSTILVFLLVGAGTFSCNPQRPTSAQPTYTAAHTPQPSATSPPLIRPTDLPANPYGVVDASSLDGKVIFGYQGWYGCPGDGSKRNSWFHWFHNSRLVVEFWPDVSEYASEELCQTALIDTRGNPLFAYSAYNPDTVMRHFRWMAEYGLDGVELQRFASELSRPALKDFRDQVLANARLGAESFGRVFYIQYDAVESQYVDKIKSDWMRLVDDHEVTESPQYLHHGGLPLVGLFGIGLQERDIGAQEALDLIIFFQENPDLRYRARVLGGVPFWWRTLENDSRTDPEWAAVYRRLDVINPWSIGRVHDRASSTILLDQVIKPDMEETRGLGIEYMPVIYPGFAWSNLNPGDPYNEIPRRGGAFLWEQANNLISSGANMIHIAMFDELDEGTAMYKLVETAGELPEGRVLVPLDIDGYSLPSDWYLSLAGQISGMLKGEVSLSPIINGLEDLYAGDVGTLFLEFTSSSDWSRLEFINPTPIRSVEITSTEGALISQEATSNVIAMNQALEDADAGRIIALMVEIHLDPMSELDSLELRLTKGDLNSTSMRFFIGVEGEEETLWEGSHFSTPNDSSGQNPYSFSIPIDISSHE